MALGDGGPSLGVNGGLSQFVAVRADRVVARRRVPLRVAALPEVGVVGVPLWRLAPPALLQVRLRVPPLRGHPEVDVPVWDAGFGLRNIVAGERMSPLVVAVLSLFDFLQLPLAVASSVWREVATLLLPVPPGL